MEVLGMILSVDPRKQERTDAFLAQFERMGPQGQKPNTVAVALRKCFCFSN